MVEKPTIPHLFAMDIDNINLKGQGRGTFNDLPRPFLVKSILFTSMRSVLPKLSQASVLLNLYFPHSDLQNEVLWVFVACTLFEKIEENPRSEIARSDIYAGQCMPQNMIGIILSLGNTCIKALMPSISVDLLPIIGNLPIPCLQDAYNYLQCMTNEY